MDLRQFGWNRFFEGAFAPHVSALTPGRVASENRGHFLIWSSGGEHSATLAGAVRDEGPAAGPVTGDWVAFDAASNRIHAVLPRRTTVSRRQPGRVVAEQVLAANVDVLFVVTALDGDFNLRRLERYLLAAHQSGAQPVILLNKSDLMADPMAPLRAADRLARGVPVVLLSALDPASAAQLHRFVEPGATAALIGSSGAGKSTIVNSLLGEQAQATRRIREDGRGRHTTTARQLFLLRQGWLLIDTPGLRELAPWVEPGAIDTVFADIEMLASGCRFRNCRHGGEPGCAVAGAIERGLLESGRLAGFQKLRRELHHLAVQQDARLAWEDKRKLKRLHKAFRDR